MLSSRPPRFQGGVAWLGLLALATLAPAFAQDVAVDPSAAAAAVVDEAVADLEARRSAAESDASLAADVKSRVLELLTRAIDERRAAATAAAEIAALEERVASAPERMSELRTRLEQSPPEPDPAAYAAVPLDELATRARDKQQELATARQALTERERELAELTARGPVLSGEIASRRRTLRELERDAEIAPPPNQVAATTSARAAYLAARRANLEAEIARAEQQLSSYELLARLANLERDAAAVLVPRLDAEREALVQAVEARRAEQARAAREAAQFTEAVTVSLPAAVARLATENATLSEELERVILETGTVAERLRAAERRVSELEADLVSIRERVTTVGPTEAIGRLLRRRLQNLDAVVTDRLRARARADEIVRATDRRIDLGERRRELADTQARVDAVLTAVPEAELAGFDPAWVREQAVALVDKKRATIDELHEAYGRYLTQLTSHDAAERQLATAAESMRGFVRRELLWIRSVPAIAPSDLAAAPRALSRLLDAASWRQALADARTTAASRPTPAVMWLAVLLALLALRGWARRRLAELGELTARIRTDAFKHTVSALLLSAMIAVAWPLILAYAGWLLGGAEDAAPFSRHVSGTLATVARLLIIFSGARWLLHPDGLASRHFRWPEPARVALRRGLRWLMPITVACVVFAGYAMREGSQESLLALGRPALMIFSAALLVFLWRLFRGSGPLMEAARRRHPDRITTRTWRLWFPLLIAIPVANILAAAAGYLYTTRVATTLLIQTAWLVLGVWALRDVMLRWFTVAERRLRFERALKLREEARAERAQQQLEGAAPSDLEAAEVEVPEVDFRGLGEQGRAVVQAAVVVGVVLSLWTLWADLLPALNVLDRLQLPFTREVLVDGVAQRVAVTATDAALALLVLAATLFAAKNLSGLLGFTLLRRIATDAGAQYAIVTLCQYALVAAGTLYAFSAIGVEWSKLQWLVAALGVGLGFGLQEIVANFVSGIILLLERPVRVGDIVTVGDATGTVARIRIRATTIIDWDRKELVVPNKEFITGRLLNWTLSNDIVRMVIPVGVAYGSDVRRARELMLEAASENEHVLADPKPLLVFNSFGDNALGLELRVYLKSMDHWLSVQTGLHDVIYDKFAAAGIVISFPQRDVHLDTSAPLDVRLRDAWDAPASPRRWWRGGRNQPRS